MDEKDTGKPRHRGGGGGSRAARHVYAKHVSGNGVVAVVWRDSTGFEYGAALPIFTEDSAIVADLKRRLGDDLVLSDLTADLVDVVDGVVKVHTVDDLERVLNIRTIAEFHEAVDGTFGGLLWK